jgi:hypothetical protein
MALEGWAVLRALRAEGPISGAARPLGLSRTTAGRRLNALEVRPVCTTTHPTVVRCDRRSRRDGLGAPTGEALTFAAPCGRLGDPLLAVPSTGGPRRFAEEVLRGPH